MITSNPSLTAYKRLQGLHSSTLICPCSNVTMPYSTFITLYPILHQVCSSDFVSESWISMMRVILTGSGSWTGLDARHFQLLSSLCQLSTKTIDDAVRRFTMNSFVTLNVLTDSNFYAELNTTLSQLNQTLIINFGLLVNTLHQCIQIDQPFTLPDDFIEEDLASIIMTNQSSDQQLPQVCLYSREKPLSSLCTERLYSDS
jgi:hypothetical protein